MPLGFIQNIKTGINNSCKFQYNLIIQMNALHSWCTAVLIHVLVHPSFSSSCTFGGSLISILNSARHGFNVNSVQTCYFFPPFQSPRGKHAVKPSIFIKGMTCFSRWRQAVLAIISEDRSFAFDTHKCFLLCELFVLGRECLNESATTFRGWNCWWLVP